MKATIMIILIKPEIKVPALIGGRIEGRVIGPSVSSVADTGSANIKKEEKLRVNKLIL